MKAVSAVEVRVYITCAGVKCSQVSFFNYEDVNSVDLNIPSEAAESFILIIAGSNSTSNIKGTDV